MLHALVINDRSDTSLSDYATSRLNSVAMNHRRLSRCVSLTLHVIVKRVSFPKATEWSNSFLSWIPRIMETSSSGRGVISSISHGGKYFRKSFASFFSPREKGFLIPGREFIGLDLEGGSVDWTAPRRYGVRRRRTIDSVRLPKNGNAVGRDFARGRTSQFRCYVP